MLLCNVYVGGCDGCMNWEGMYSETPDPNNKDHYYKFDPINATDNKGKAVEGLGTI